MASLRRVSPRASLATRVNMARPHRTTGLSPPGDIRVPPSFSSQSTYPDQSGSTSTRANTPFMQKGETGAPLRIHLALLLGSKALVSQIWTRRWPVLVFPRDNEWPLSGESVHALALPLGFSWHVHRGPLVYILRETYECHQVFPRSKHTPISREARPLGQMTESLPGVIFRTAKG